MSIAPEEFVSYMAAAFDGMLAIAEALGDARLNQRPQNMPKCWDVDPPARALRSVAEISSLSPF